MATAVIQPAFSAGELSPTLFARVDLAKYHSGAALMRNMFCDFRGGASNRPGTEYIDTIDSVGQPRVIDFVVATQAAYVLVFLTGFIRVYANGAFVAQIASPYATADLPLLKYTQSASVLTLTHPLYPVYNFTQTGPTSFQIIPDVIGPVTPPPTGVTLITSFSGVTGSLYGYVVTAVSADGKEESISTFPAFIDMDNFANATYISANISFAAPAVPVSYYKIYKNGPFSSRTVGTGDPTAVSSVFGYIGQALGTTFTDNNIAPDYSQTPPAFQDPFSPGQVASITVSGAGSGYTTIYVIALVFSGGGIGGPGVVSPTGYAIIDPHVNTVIAAVLTNPGRNLTGVPTVTDANGSATYVATLGQMTGTYPLCATYFQQRRTFGGTTNFPETFVASQPGYFDNFDTSPVSLPSDSITASISSRQDNSIKAMVAMPTGLVILTTGGGFLVSGGNAQAAITPSDVVAFPQSSSGANDVPPLLVPAGGSGIGAGGGQLLYITNRGNNVRDLSFSFYTQSYAGQDRNLLASHLFLGYTITEWAYAEEPFRLIHAIRSDGTMLAFTYVPEQEIYAWTHYDTNGTFISVAAIPEGQQNAVYVITKRFNSGIYSYFLERFASRIFNFVQDTWFVDAGLALPHTFPATDLQPDPGAGTAGAVNIPFTALDATPFDDGDLGKVIWGTLMGGGQAVVTSVPDPRHLGCTIIQPFPLTPNDPGKLPVALPQGQWSLDTPVSVVSGLDHLDSLIVSGIADGVPFSGLTVVGGSITLPGGPASKVVVGLPYTSQLQTLKLDTGDPTTRNKRKNIPAVTWIVDKTLGITTGPDFNNMRAVKSPNMVPQAFPQPLISDDLRTIVDVVWKENGQFVVQQSNPLPCSLLGTVPEVLVGDTGR